MVYGLLERVDPCAFSEPPIYHGYIGGLTLSRPETPGQSSLWVFEFTGVGEGNLLGDSVLIPEMDPAKDYRLVFDGVGNELTVQLFDRQAPDTAIARVTRFDTTLIEGHVGFYAWAEIGCGPTCRGVSS